MKSKKKTKKYIVGILAATILIIIGGTFLYVTRPKGNSKIEVSETTKKQTEQKDADRSPARNSRFKTNTWVSNAVPAVLSESSVAPGQTGTFEFPITVPAGSGTFIEYFNPLAEGITFFNNDVGQFFPIRVD